MARLRRPRGAIRLAAPFSRSLLLDQVEDDFGLTADREAVKVA
jgi:hypothetical protein